MRYDKNVFFQRVIPGQYNQSTGNYECDAVIEENRHASVVDTSVEKMNLVYGSIKQGSKTIHLQTKFDKKYDRIRIDKKVYRVDFVKDLPDRKQILTVSEIQGADAHGRTDN